MCAGGGVDVLVNALLRKGLEAVFFLSSFSPLLRSFSGSIAFIYMRSVLFFCSVKKSNGGTAVVVVV